MTVRPGGEPHCVVVGYDGSDVSRAAVSWAADHLRSQGRLHVVHCRPPGRGVDEAVVLATLHIQTGEVLTGMDWDFEILEGHPARVLLAAAHRHEADEIVVGLSSDGRTASGHDSVARDLIGAAGLPVVVVPAPLP